MKAIALEKYGTGTDLDLIDRDIPVVKAQEVLIRVHAAAVNLIDLKKAAGAFKDFMPLTFPWTPGVDFSGIIELVGSLCLSCWPFNIRYMPFSRNCSPRMRTWWRSPG
jgi:NADPH:quinone reductase-like Zn-dependent oxidoreductase